MSDTELTALKRAVEDARRVFLRDLATCEAALTPHGFPPDKAKDLTAVAEEFGQDYVLEQLVSDPSAIGLIFKDPATHKTALTTLEPAISALLDSSYDLDAATVEREHYLIAKDPAHQQVFNHYGREFTVDFKKQTWTFLDTPHLTYALVATYHPNRSAPDLEHLTDQRHTQKARDR